jgi:tRNA(Arg) A34 adenosine deaminase TadA
MTDEDFMRVAIRAAREGIAAGQSPFGSAIVRDGAVIAATHNSVWLDGDPTAHAEIICLRRAASALKNIFLNGCTLYSTTEPCPMCISAIHWARLDRCVYGATIADAAAAGFREMPVDARTLTTMGKSPLKIESGVLQEECAALFEQWKASGKARPY